jgi:hypothetical protein
MKSAMKNLWLSLSIFVATGSTLFANGGAWQTGIRETGNVSASDKDRHTDVAIENETVKIDLHQECAAVDVHYRMHNTGPKVQQDFFFPVERWGRNETADAEIKEGNIEHYRISVDGKELKVTDVARPKEKGSETKEGTSEANQESSETKEETSDGNNEATQDSSQAEEESSEADEEGDETTSGPLWQEELSTIKSWKKSVIPFERNQTRDVTIRYNARYAENDESVSDDSHNSDVTFAYRSRRPPLGKARSAKERSRSAFCIPNPKMFQSRSRRSGSIKSAIRVTNGTLKI